MLVSATPLRANSTSWGLGALARILCTVTAFSSAMDAGATQSKAAQSKMFMQEVIKLNGIFVVFRFDMSCLCINGIRPHKAIALVPLCHCVIVSLLLTSTSTGLISCLITNNISKHDEGRDGNQINDY
jgi:hypothetical protein